MTAPLPDPRPDPDPAQGERRRADSIAALCLLLEDRDGLPRTDNEVAEAVERARVLLATDTGPGPGSRPDPGQLDDAFRAVDDALRRAGDSRGLLGHVRGILGGPPPATTLPGLRSTIKVALCPGTEPCTRREPTRDLRPAPPCAVNGAQMRKVRLRQDSTE